MKMYSEIRSTADELITRITTFSGVLVSTVTFWCLSQRPLESNLRKLLIVLCLFNVPFSWADHNFLKQSQVSAGVTGCCDLWDRFNEILVQNETFSCRASRTVLIGLCANLLLFEWNYSLRFLTVPCPKMRLHTCRHKQKRKGMDSSVRFSANGMCCFQRVDGLAFLYTNSSLNSQPFT